jgi:flagellar assembly protein FliH
MSSEAAAAAFAFEQLEALAGSERNGGDFLSHALAEAERLKAQARATGHREGWAAGIEEGRTELLSAAGVLRSALDGIEQLREELLAALERDAAELALALCEQILAGALEVQPERIVDVARNALRRVVDRRRITLVVNPADLETLSEAVVRLQSELGGIEHCEVQSDRRIGRGGALLRTEAGEIDVTVTSQLERAREIVAEALVREPDDA